MFHTDLTESVPPFVAFFWEIYYSQLHELCKLYRLISISTTVELPFFEIPFSNRLNRSDGANSVVCANFN